MNYSSHAATEQSTPRSAFLRLSLTLPPTLAKILKSRYIVTLYSNYNTIGHSLLGTSVTMCVGCLAKSGAGTTSTSGGSGPVQSQGSLSSAAKARSITGLGLSSILLAVAFAAVGFMASMYVMSSV